MARIVRPQFGTRQHRPSPNWYRPQPPPAKPWRIDWQVVSLVAIVFFGSIVWLLPALEQGGLLDGVLTGGEDPPRRATWSSPIQVVNGDTVRSGGRTYRLVGFNTP